MAQHPHLPSSIDHDYDPEQHKLTLRNIEKVPAEIFEIADDIVIFDIGNNRISELPADFGRLAQLEVFFASYTDFVEVPHPLGDCPKLRIIGMQSCRISTVPIESLPKSLEVLILTDNAVTALPDSFDSLPKLRKIGMPGNQLTALPRSLLNCDHLELVRFAANKIVTCPEWLLQHPALAWYGDMGNSYSLRPAKDSQRLVSWHDLQDQELISSNRKNKVYATKLKSSGEAVAVKLYGMPISPDGNSEDEINVSLALGEANMARVTNAPDDWPGLMMPLLSKKLRNLASVPSFTTMTRDTYPEDQQFAPAVVTRILRDIAGQLADMHAKHVMHGDVYGHNILYDPETGQARLTDFGAASLYSPTIDQLHERVEVRAFGILTSELIARCPEALPKLETLRDSCLRSDVATRPLFADILAAP